MVFRFDTATDASCAMWLLGARERARRETAVVMVVVSTFLSILIIEVMWMGMFFGIIVVKLCN